MSNCLFEAAYEETLRVCKCVPSFHQVALQELDWLRICTGTKLKCMKKIFHGIGNYKLVRNDYYKDTQEDTKPLLKFSSLLRM